MFASITFKPIVFGCIFLFSFQVAANACDGNNCLNALRRFSLTAASFCGTYTTNNAIATPSEFLAACGATPSKLLSACSCINTALTTSTGSSTSINPTVSTTVTPTSTSSPLAAPTSSTSTSTCPPISYTTIFVTLPPLSTTVDETIATTLDQFITTTVNQTITTTATETIGPPTCAPSSPPISCDVCEGLILTAVNFCAFNSISNAAAQLPNSDCFILGMNLPILEQNFVNGCICPCQSQSQWPDWISQCSFPIAGFDHAPLALQLMAYGCDCYNGCIE